MVIKKKIFFNKNILITGNTGFIGSWISMYLFELGAKLFCISKDKKKNYISNTKQYKKNIKTYFINLKNINKIQHKIKAFKPEILIHLASQPLVIKSYKKPIETFETNIMGSVKLYEIVKKIDTIKKILIFTSDKVYKYSKKKLDEKDHLGGNDPYGASKSCQDILSSVYANNFFDKKKTIILRAGNIIGGSDFSKDRIIADIFKSIKQKKILKIRNLNAIRPWQNIFDIVKVILEILKTKQKEKLTIFNVATKTKKNYKVKDIIKEIKKNLYLKYNLKKSKYKENNFLSLNTKKIFLKYPNLRFMNFKKNIKLTLLWYYNCYLINKNLNMYEYSKKQIKDYLNAN